MSLLPLEDGNLNEQRRFLMQLLSLMARLRLKRQHAWQHKVSAKDQGGPWLIIWGETDSETEEDNSLFLVDSDMAEAEEVLSDRDDHQVGAALPRKSAKRGKAVCSDMETAHKQLAMKNNANVAHHQVSLKRKGEDADIR